MLYLFEREHDKRRSLTTTVRPSNLPRLSVIGLSRFSHLTLNSHFNRSTPTTRDIAASDEFAICVSSCALQLELDAVAVLETIASKEQAHS